MTQHGLRAFALPGGYVYCANPRKLPNLDRGTIYNPSGTIYRSTRNRADLAILLRLIRSGQA